ncbi:MAG: hypothetical protein VW270_11860, partial [Candidatus Poseidoniales archaeon]
LYVSAENSQFDNYMTGPQVVEVVVIDENIDETNEARGEPDVTVNGAKLRMVQTTDGNWYGYFAEYDQAKIADATAAEIAAPGYGLDFGQFCGSDSTILHIDATTQLFSDTDGVAVPLRSNGSNFGLNGTDFDNSSDGCTTTFVGASTSTNRVLSANATYPYSDLQKSTASTAVEARVMNVVREAKTINTDPSAGFGQIGLHSPALWPFIQLYDLTTGGDVVIQYNKAGGAQRVTLTFDTADDMITTTLDRTKYPIGAEVHVEIADAWLNIDPTDEDSWTFDTDSTPGIYYAAYDENGVAKATGNNLVNLYSAKLNQAGNAGDQLTALMNGDALLKITTTATGSTATIAFDNNANGATNVVGSAAVTMVEQGPASGIFASYDELDDSMIGINSSAVRGTSGTIDYNDDAVSVVVGLSFATIDIEPTDDTWSSGEEIPVTLADGDLNKNSRADEDIAINDNNFTIIPTIVTGDPFTLGERGTSGNNATKAIYLDDAAVSGAGAITGTVRAVSTLSVDDFSLVGRMSQASSNVEVNGLLVDFSSDLTEFRQTFQDTSVTSGLRGFNLVNIDLRALNTTGTFDMFLVNATTDIIPTTTTVGFGSMGTFNEPLLNDVSPQSLTVVNGTGGATAGTYAHIMSTIASAAATTNVGVLFIYSDSTDNAKAADGVVPFVVDFFSYGFTNDGYDTLDRVSNQIIRLELEESGDNTGVFEGSIEYVMISQLNILDSATYSGLSTISDSVSLIAIEDLTDEDSIRVNYKDVGADGVATQIADQEAAPTHSGVVSFDSENYKVADTVTITLEDHDLNADSSLIDIYTVVATSGNANYDMVGNIATGYTVLSDSTSLTRLLDVTFDDEIWKKADQGSTTCSAPSTGVDDGLADTDFTLVETDVESGVFVGDFQIPSTYCKRTGTTGQTSTTGVDIEVNYVDFRDASGETVEVGDGAGVRANTGSVTLDRTVYPVPFGVTADFPNNNDSSLPDSRSVFPIHQTGVDATTTLATGEYIANGDLTIHVRVNDPDYDISASGEDTIAAASGSVGVVKISVIRGSDKVVLGYAGSAAANSGVIDVADNNGAKATAIKQFGPMTEIAPDAGIFESDITIRYTDGPASTDCPSSISFVGLNGTARGSNAVRFDAAADNYCILQGDILQVEYTDPTDASGDSNTVTDSATFDLRNGVLQVDKSVYIIGSDIILTLIEPDFDLDNDGAETYDLDLIEWDSDAFTNTIGNKGGEATTFDPEPSDFRETGDSTGIFQVVLEM